MSLPLAPRAALALAALAFAAHTHAGSFTSSAAAGSSAGSSASSGSVSDSFQGSSNSSTRDEKTASGDYRITEVAQAPDRAGMARVTMQSQADARRQLVLDLPQHIARKEGLVQGGVVHAQQRAYGFEFAQAAAQEPFFLVLADDWQADLPARPVTL